MIFVVDIGNSTLHIALYNNGNISDRCDIRHKDTPVADVASALQTWINTYRNQSVTTVSVGSVYTPLNELVKDVCTEYNCFFVTADLNAGIHIDYDPRASFGADRFANLVAFRNMYGTAGAVVDIGSAVTVDVIDAHGLFFGGLIMPGPSLSLQAMHTSTDLLPSVLADSITMSGASWGRSTQSCMALGVNRMYTFIIPALIEEARAALNDPDFTAVVCGGWHHAWQSAWSGIDAYLPDLTLKGIGDIYRAVNE